MWSPEHHRLGRDMIASSGRATAHAPEWDLAVRVDSYTNLQTCMHLHIAGWRASSIGSGGSRRQQRRCSDQG